VSTSYYTKRSLELFLKQAVFFDLTLKFLSFNKIVFVTEIRIKTIEENPQNLNTKSKVFQFSIPLAIPNNYWS